MRYLIPILLILSACEVDNSPVVEYPRGILDNMLQYETIDVVPGRTYGLTLQQNEPGRITATIERDDMIKINWWSFNLASQTGWQFDGGVFYFNTVGFADVNITISEKLPGRITISRDGVDIKTVILR